MPPIRARVGQRIGAVFAMVALLGVSACTSSPGTAPTPVSTSGGVASATATQSAQSAPSSAATTAGQAPSKSVNPAPSVAPSVSTAAVLTATPAGESAATVTSRALAARITDVLGKQGDSVSVTVLDRRSGAVTRVNPGMRTATASIVKVMILVAAIRERREDGKALSSGQRSMASRMIKVSDNDAATALFRQAGGTRALQDVADDFGMTRTTASTSWGTTMTTAADQALLMDRLVGGTPLLSTADRRYILSLMGSVVDEQRWGVGSVPGDDGSTHVKNGWLPLSSHGWRVNSIGHVADANHDYVLAMLSSDNATMQAGVSRLDEVSKVVYAATGS